MTSKNEMKLVPYWVIINHKTNSIWKTTCLSLKEAREELTSQEQIHGKKHDWVIEQRESYRKNDFGYL